jgi:2,3-diketo-5-methylthio-1-phosphopentane phosphatase
MPDRTVRDLLIAGSQERGETAGFRVFIDFDNTITMGDVLDGVIQRFAPDDSWRVLEKAWEEGRIGARDCLDGQLRSLRATWGELSRHFEGVNLDPGFLELRRVVREQRVEMTIVSDNFDLFIGHILRRNGLADVPFHANHVELDSGRMIPSFPFGDFGCPDCAHCKKTHFIAANRDQRHVVYIGDGRSDICPARNADTVFAKASLLTYMRKASLPCIPFTGLGEVARSFEKILHESKT